MKLKQKIFNRTYEVSKTGVIVVYPSLRTTRNTRGTSLLLRLLGRLRKAR
jgi:hypothetical protein